MEIKSVGILGAGAVGSYIFWGLNNKTDVNVYFLAENERKARYEKEGMIINGQKYYPTVKSFDKANSPDLLIVCLKYNSLRPALTEIKRVVTDKTIVMSLMNGVDSEEIISEVVDEKQIIYSLIKIASERNNNEVKFAPETTIGLIYGEKDKSIGEDRKEALTRLFEGSGLHYRSSDVIEEEIWEKFLLNVGNNLIQAIAGCGVGGYEDSEHLAFLKNKMREEVIAIAKAKKIDLIMIDESSLVGSVVKPRARYSTLQDLDAKRHTEIDMFAGAVVRMGRELNIATPYNEYTYHMIKALEEKNDGMFDYE